MSWADAARSVREDVGAASDFDAPEATVEARVEATEEPGVLRFSTHEVPGSLYRIAVDVDDPDCAEVEWRGLAGGLVAAGDEDVALEAIALRTQLKVQATTEPGGPWVSAAFVEDPDAPLRFRVRSNFDGVLAYDLQFSYARFAVDDLDDERSFCDPPSGAPPVYRVEAPPGGREFSVDISSYFRRPEPGASTAERRRYQRLLLGAPVYVRAVPVGRGGTLCDLRANGASSWVRLVLRPRVDVPSVEIPDVPPYRVVGSYNPGYFPVPEIIAYDFRCHRVIIEHELPDYPYLTPQDWVHGDLYGYLLVVHGLYPLGGTAHVGDQFCVAPPRDHGNWLDDIAEGFADLVGTVLDAAEWLADRAAALYQEIKEAAVDLVARAVADLTGCEEICRAALEFGMEAALASMGMPPSLPDFDELMDQGLDYVAAELAAQTGVPDFVAEEALELAIEMAEAATATRGASYADWLVEDTQGRSSVFELDVSRTVTGASTTWEALWFRPLDAGEDVWIQRFMAVHPPAVGEGSLHVPVVIERQLAGLPSVDPLLPMGPLWPAYYGSAQRTQAWYEREWGRRMGATPCVHFELWGALSTEIPVVVEPVADVTISHDAEFDGFATPTERQCVP